MTRTSKKVRVPDLAVMKERGERIVMLTAYDATMARLLDRAGIDLLLVGDSLGNVILGLDTTIPVSLDAILHHTRAVTQGASRALVVADMPFLTYQVSVEQAMHNAARLFQEAGAAAVKIEGGRTVAETVTSRLKIPTIGIGAGPHCDGQVLVSYDMLGLFDTFVPSFVRQYAQLGDLIFDAARNYANDVREGVYPQSAAARRNGAPALVGE